MRTKLSELKAPKWPTKTQRKSQVRGNCDNCIEQLNPLERSRLMTRRRYRLLGRPSLKQTVCVCVKPLDLSNWTTLSWLSLKRQMACQSQLLQSDRWQPTTADGLARLISESSSSSSAYVTLGHYDMLVASVRVWTSFSRVITAATAAKGETNMTIVWRRHANVQFSPKYRASLRENLHCLGIAQLASLLLIEAP